MADARGNLQPGDAAPSPDFDLLRNEIEGSSNVKTNNGNGWCGLRRFFASHARTSHGNGNGGKFLVIIFAKKSEHAQRKFYIYKATTPGIEIL